MLPKLGRAPSPHPALQRSATRYWPTGVGISLSNTLLVFGGFVAGAVLWQRFAGTVYVRPVVATLVVATVAFVATAIADWHTKNVMLRGGAINA